MTPSPWGEACGAGLASVAAGEIASAPFGFVAAESYGWHSGTGADDRPSADRQSP